MTREQAETVRQNILLNNPGALIDIVENNGDWAVVQRSPAPTLGAGATAGSRPEATPIPEKE